ncbi:hypothetical protein E2C01_086924 [Portunus trituberculatus]|uniref:Uncharacterized protein n=1 Tax=Portunus trituberculatus TaxID=210409 RepID=A0A5B7JBX6_PORTR|nr:hypothetical protein [Portunus trituberculatus]
MPLPCPNYSSSCHCKKSDSVILPVDCGTVPRPSLPVYQDDLTSYFTRFELFAALLNIPQDQYAIQLGGLLSGKLAEIYTTLADNVIRDYPKLEFSP